VLAVAATSPTVAFSLTSFSASGLLLVEDGQPTEVVQAADSDPQILLYSINGDPTLPDVRFTWDVDASSAALRWYLTSCVDGQCAPGAQYPSPASAMASSVLDAGRRVDVVVSPKAGSAYAGAYCRANASDAVCNYYLVVVPVPEDCAARGISPCLATLTLTATFQGSLAPVQLDAGALAGKVWRIGLMGYNSTPENVDRLLHLFETELPAFRPSTPVAAAVGWPKSAASA
jgi:hypothetical protein